MRLIFTTVVAILLLTNCASAQVNCSDVLVQNKTSFSSSMSRWLAFIDEVQRSSSTDRSKEGGFGYGGIEMNFGEAAAANDFFRQNTNYSLSEQQSFSLVTSQLPPESAKAFVDCVREVKADVSIKAPPGSDQEGMFQIRVDWTPTYSVAVLADKGTRRPVTLLSTNANIAVAEKEAEPTNSVTFTVQRMSLDEPVYLTASVDGKESEILVFPRRPTHRLVSDGPQSASVSIGRSVNEGASELSTLLCLPAVGTDSWYVPSTTIKAVTGSGNDWQNRSRVDWVDQSYRNVCATVWTGGIPCDDPDCGHTTTGTITATRMSIVPIQYD